MKKFIAVLFPLILVVAALFVSIGDLSAKSRTLFPKGIMFGPMTSLRWPLHNMHEYGFTSEQQWRNNIGDYYFQGLSGGMRDAFKIFDTLNSNWVYQEYITQQEIADLNRPDLFFTVTDKVLGDYGRFLKACRANVDVGWEYGLQSQSLPQHAWDGRATLWPGDLTSDSGVGRTLPDIGLPPGKDHMLYAEHDVESAGWMLWPGDRIFDDSTENITRFARDGGTTVLGGRWHGNNHDWDYAQPSGITNFIVEPLCKVPMETDTSACDSVAEIFLFMYTFCDGGYSPASISEPVDSIRARGHRYLSNVVDFGSVILRTCDFRHPGEYETLSDTLPLRFWFPNGCYVKVGIYWYNTSTFSIANLDVRDQYWDSLFHKDTGYPKQFFQEVYSSLNSMIQPMPHGAIQIDEPSWPEYHTLAAFNQSLTNGITINAESTDTNLVKWCIDSTACRLMSNDQASPSGAWASERTRGGNERTVTGLNPASQYSLWGLVHLPPTDSASILGNLPAFDNRYAQILNTDTCAMSLQAFWDFAIDERTFWEHMVDIGQLYENWFNRAMNGGGIKYQADLARKQDVPWTAYISHASGMMGDSMTVVLNAAPLCTVVVAQRCHTPQEMWCQTGLNLAYGAKGIIWATLSSFLTNGTTWGQRQHKEPQFTTLKNIYACLDTIGPILAACDWVESFATRSCEVNQDYPFIFGQGQLSLQVWSVTSTVLNNVHLDELSYWEEDRDSTFLQFGIFKAPGDDGATCRDWFVLVVNRRCLQASDNHEWRRVDFSLSLPEDAYVIHNVRANTVSCDSAMGDGIVDVSIPRSAGAS